MPAALVAAVWASSLSGFTSVLDTVLSDLRFSASDRQASGGIVLVDIDAKSLAEVGVWPWPRRLHGELVKAAELSGAARLAFDVDFSSNSRPQDDEAFAEALRNAGLETFLAAFAQRDPASGAWHASMPIEPLLSASWPASVNVPIDGDGRVRRFPWALDAGGEGIASMPAVLADRSGSGTEFLIDHGIAASSIPRVAFVDLLEGRLEPGVLRGATLVVGATAIELRDLFPVPGAGIVSGSTVIALAAETLIQDRALTPWSPPLPLLALLLAVGAVLVLRLSMRVSVAVLAASAVIVEAAAVALYLDHALMARTAGLQVALFGLCVLSASREFGLRRRRLRTARTETRNTMRLLERVVDDGFDAVVIVDAKGRIARINETARRLLAMPGAGQADDVARLPETLRRAVEAGMAASLGDGEEPRRLRGTDRLVSETGTRFVEYSIASFRMDGNETASGEPERSRFVAVMLRDVTEREETQERLRIAALHDSLTGLPNRRAMEESLGALTPGSAPVTLVAFDLDRFKGVNDALGHATGDAVLVETARRAALALPAGASLYRIGGDEFVALLHTADDGLATAVADDLIRELSRTFLVHGHQVTVGASVGIAPGGVEGFDASALRRRADVALYQAKRGGNGRVVSFDPEMETIRLRRLALESDLRRAIETGSLEVAYQPQVLLSDRRWTGAEALVRWRHPEYGFVSPAEFVPVAEEMGLIHELGAHVLRVACMDARRWPAPVKVAVNVSPLQLAAGDVVGAVRGALAASGLDPTRLELEITESSFVGESERLDGIFAELLSLGTSFALDDFGTGYSSLGHLHRFPVSKIKIDRGFVVDIPGNRHSMAVLRSVMALADGLSIRSIAEGIETADQAALLGQLGCKEGQGYLFSKPVGAEAVLELLTRSGRFDLAV